MVVEGSAADVVVLGLPGFVVLEARAVAGELEVTIETAAVVVGCAGCGTRARSKGRSRVRVRDVDAFGRRVQLRWRKRRWRCAENACAARTWTEASDAIRRGRC